MHGMGISHSRVPFASDSKRILVQNLSIWKLVLVSLVRLIPSLGTVTRESIAHNLSFEWSLIGDLSRYVNVRNR